MILAVDGQEVEQFYEVRDYVFAHPGETVEIAYERDGAVSVANVEVDPVTRINLQTGEVIEAGAIGVAAAPVKDPVKQFGPLEAVAATAKFTGEMLGATVQGIISFPSKIPGVVASIFGAERDIEGPVSVIGASRAGGELVERQAWPVFFMMLASICLLYTSPSPRDS